LTKHYLKSADTDWYRRRLNGTLVIVLAAFLVLGLRLFHLQVVQGKEYRRLSENNCIRLQGIDPPGARFSTAGAACWWTTGRRSTW
jgi:penicillin-binding protein 2